MKNVAFKLIGHYLICAYNELPPSDADGRTALEIFRSLDLDKVKVLTFTKGGAPTAKQRKDINDVLNGRQLTTAVVSDAVLIRGVVTAFSWFNTKIRAFPGSALEDAFQYLDIPTSRWDYFAAEAAKVQEEVGKPPSPQSKTLPGVRRA
jgi:hypothetical protein